MTAVEWLISELMSKGIIDADEWVWNDDISILDITNQAKEMEKQQAIDFTYEIADDLAHGVYSKKAIEDLFNETFKK